jgi:hypothetical protein
MRPKIAEEGRAEEKMRGGRRCHLPHVPSVGLDGRAFVGVSSSGQGSEEGGREEADRLVHSDGILLSGDPGSVEGPGLDHRDHFVVGHISSGGVVSRGLGTVTRTNLTTDSALPSQPCSVLPIPDCQRWCP